MTTGSLPRVSQLRALLSDDATPLSVAFFAAVAAGGYDPEIAAMDPEAFIAEVQANIDVELSDLIGSKIIAGQTLYFTDLIYQDLPAFIDFANLVEAEDAPAPNLFNPASVSECSLALLEIAVIEYSIDEEDKRSKQKPSDVIGFSEEIRKYWGAILVSEGAAWPIAPLTQAIVPQMEAEIDPGMFGAIDTSTKDFEKITANSVWQQGFDIFEGLKKIPAHDGRPLIKAAEMSKLIERLVGPQPQ